MATALATVALILVAYKQLGDLGRTSKSDFIFRLKNQFFTKATRQLYFLVEQGLIRFVPEPMHFQVAADEGKYALAFEELGIQKKIVTTYTIDDELLGPLEDVGLLLKAGTITQEQAYEVFYTYVRSCFENKAIKKYIAYLRVRPGDSDIYSGFEDLYKKLAKYAKSHHS
jgi:hypothetical protein